MSDAYGVRRVGTLWEVYGIVSGEVLCRLPRLRDAIGMAVVANTLHSRMQERNHADA